MSISAPPRTKHPSGALTYKGVPGGYSPAGQIAPRRHGSRFDYRVLRDARRRNHSTPNGDHSDDDHDGQREVTHQVPDRGMSDPPRENVAEPTTVVTVAGELLDRTHLQDPIPGAAPLPCPAPRGASGADELEQLLCVESVPLQQRRGDAIDSLRLVAEETLDIGARLTDQGIQSERPTVGARVLAGRDDRERTLSDLTDVTPSPPTS